MSASEYRYGLVRRRGGSHLVAGTSVAGSLACSQLAKPRTTVSRMRSHDGDAFAGAVTHANASSLVTRPAPACSQKATNCSSSRPSRASLKPSERRTARYWASAVRSVCSLMPHLPARAGRADAARRSRPWRRSPSCRQRRVGGSDRPLLAMLRHGAFHSLGCAEDGEFRPLVLWLDRRLRTLFR